MAGELCEKCKKIMARVSKWFQCSGCRALFCPSCMDRSCFFCKAPVKDTPPR